MVVGEHEVKKERNDVALAVRRAYYGLQLSRDSLALVREAKARVDKYVTRLAARVATPESMTQNVVAIMC